MPKETKKYKLEGKVLNIYKPREVTAKYGKEVKKNQVTDVQMQTPKGNKVRLSFWNQDVSDVNEGDTIRVVPVISSGSYKGTAQYSSIKDTEVEVLESAAPAEEETVEPEPEAAEPEVEEVEEAEVEEAPEETTPVVKKATRKVVAKDKPPNTVTSKNVTDPAAENLVRSLAETAWEITNDVAPDSVKEHPQAYQAAFATVFISLGLKDYSAKGGK